MAIVQGLCRSYKLEILQGVHKENDAYKIALYTSEAELNDRTTAYTPAGEVKGGGGYIAGGRLLTGFSAQISGGVAFVDFDDAAWGPGATIKASGALIHNGNRDNKAVAVLNFGSSFSCINGRFLLEFPEPTRDKALIRIA